MTTTDRDHSDTSSSPQSLGQQVEAVLRRRNYTTDLPLLKVLTESFEYNNAKTLQKVDRYKISGLVLLVAVPVVSTLIAFVVNIQDGTDANPPLSWLGKSLPLLSLCLALLTVLDSVFKPAVRFDQSCRIGLDLFHWRCELLEGLEQLDPLNDKTLVNYLAEERKQLKKLQEAPISLALPDQSRPA